VFLVRMGK